MHAVAAHDSHPPVENDHAFGDVDKKKLAMWLFLGSDAMGFTGLLGAYTVLRLSHGAEWMLLDGKPIQLPQVLTGVNTFLLICSSVTMVLALAALRRGEDKRFKTCLALTALGGIGFLCIQAYEWTHMIHSGYTSQSGLFGGTFYLLTGFHGFHVLGGVVLLLWALVRAMKGVYTKDNYIGIEVVGLYWHFVDLVWILLFTFIYLL
jgi:heme/copper-type cytochrome/quinol oxidase subunit 3